jgi:hypothetical protein
VEIAAVVDPNAATTTFVGLPVVADFEAVGWFDAIVVTDLRSARATFGRALERVGPDRVLVPKLLGLRTVRTEAVE